jgi:hypothetical protein
MVPLKNGWRLFPSKIGVLSGILIGGAGLGIMIFSKLTTAIVNPENEIA